MWSTAILTYLPVLTFHIIIGSNVRFYAHDFTVPMMWDSEVANCKTEVHLTNTRSEVMRACNVTTIKHEGDIITSLGI